MRKKASPKVAYITIILFVVMLSGCTTNTIDHTHQSDDQNNSQLIVQEHSLPETLVTLLPQPRQPGESVFTPTPDTPHLLPEIRTEHDTYIVQPNDTLGKIANRYSVPLSSIIENNLIENPDYVEIGQTLHIPPPELKPVGPDFKIIPDSELVNGPYSTVVDLDAWLQDNQYHFAYSEEIFDRTFTGIEITHRIARDYSINPRLLLAILEYRSGWVTELRDQNNLSNYPIVEDPYRDSLYRQFAWLANNLNRGYYLWKVNAISSWVLADGSVVPVAPTINAGTAGVQYAMSLLMNYSEWQLAVGPDGIFETYTQLFGYPFDFSIEPLIPSDLSQPKLQLPFEKGKVWSFTGGPHGAWGDGSAWAAIDFAPPGNALGCVQSDEWVTSVADGTITRSEDGIVVLDLDGDGFEQTGWVVFYLHIETRDRIPKGTFVQAGDHIGHPSCEGGLSNGTHVHIARKYNGEWISADGSMPFILDGWVSEGFGIEYDGYLKKNNQTIEAWDRRDEKNQIQR